MKELRCSVCQYPLEPEVEDGSCLEVFDMGLCGYCGTVAIVTYDYVLQPLTKQGLFFLSQVDPEAYEYFYRRSMEIADRVMLN